MTQKQEKRRWTDAMVDAELRAVAESLGHFPSVSELRGSGRNDLACATTKRGGVLAWSERLGIGRQHSDSDTGWEGEAAFVKLCEGRGLKAERMKAVKHPFDILVGDALRVDVKSANLRTYQHSTGWFYRIGKAPQADAVILYQLDTGNFYGLPWWMVPQSNITIARTGGKYAAHLNNWDWIEKTLACRLEEMRQQHGEKGGFR